MYKNSDFSGSCNIDNHDAPSINFRFSNRLPAQRYKGDGAINKGLPGLGLYQKASAYGDYVDVHQNSWDLPITDEQISNKEHFTMPLLEQHITYPMTSGESKMVIIVTILLLLLILYFFKEL